LAEIIEKKKKTFGVQPFLSRQAEKSGRTSGEQVEKRLAHFSKSNLVRAWNSLRKSLRTVREKDA